MRIADDRHRLCRAWSRAPASPSSASTSSASTRTQPRSRACAAGEIPIFEPGLDELVARQRQGRAPRPSPPTSPAAVAGADAVFIAVGTPSAAAATAMPISPMSSPPPRRSRRRSTGYAVVVTKSTVPVGTGREVDAHHPRGPARRPSSTSPPTRNSCAKARRSTISCAPTGSSSAPRPSARAR